MPIQETTAERVNKHLARRDDPDTSKDAAANLDSATTSAVKGAILALLREEPRADHELIPAYFALRVENGWPLVQLHSIPRRRSELVHKDSLVRDSGDRRKSQFGVAAVVWELVPEENASAESALSTIHSILGWPVAS